MRLPILAALWSAILWTAILVTLLSALAPLGPPQSRATGSAFNPATADVVLKARTQAASPIVAMPRPDGDGAPPSLILPLALAIVLLTFYHVRQKGADVRHRDHLPSYPRACARHARAPPATS